MVHILNIPIAITSTIVNLHAWNCVSCSEVRALYCSRYFKLKVLEQFEFCLIVILIPNLFSKVGPKITITSFWPPLKWQGVDMHTCLLFLDNITMLIFSERSKPSDEALITVAFLILANSNQHIWTKLLSMAQRQSVNISIVKLRFRLFFFDHQIIYI